MKSSRPVALALLGVFVSAMAPAQEYLRNGSIEELPFGTGWVESGPSGSLFGDFSAETEGRVLTNSVRMGGADDARYGLSQTFNVEVGVDSATLSFDLTRNVVDDIFADFIEVTLDDLLVDRVPMGVDSDEEFWDFRRVSYDLGNLSAGTHRITFAQVTDVDFPSTGYLDNFSLRNAAPVPEPASMVALGMGAVALIRRRRKA